MSMTRVAFEFHTYRYMPYEKRLANLEVEKLVGIGPDRVKGSLQVDVPGRVDIETLKRLTYFRNIVVADEQKVIPQQARLEASVTKHGDPTKLSRQYTRYSAHGLHEYRGKFNPQMVRAIANMLGLSVGSRIWDPFCGSGTVLLEAWHQGYNAVGVDLNPLAISISNAKLSAMRADPKSLELAVKKVETKVQSKGKWLAGPPPIEESINNALGKYWMQRLPNQDYLARWFPSPVLAQFLIILDSIATVQDSSIRDVFRVILSDVVRSVSWQDPNDLRVRRRKDPANNYPAIDTFVYALKNRVNSVLAAQRYTSDYQGWQSAFIGNSGEFYSMEKPIQQFLNEGVDCVLSSPPYATALPYIDTQRLSLALLGLANPKEIRYLDSALVGSREVSTQERRALEEEITDNRAKIARKAWMLCKELQGAYDARTDGFRRRNTPAVIYRYFAGITRVMTLAAKSLKRGGHLAFIIGPNRTSLGGKPFFVNTPSLLAEVGEQVGLELRQMHKLNAYNRYNIHSRNSIREECLLVMERV